VSALRAKVADTPMETAIWSEADVASAQMADEELKKIYHLVKAKGSDIPAEDVIGTDHLTRAYWAQRQLLFIDNNVLYRRWVSADGLQQRPLIVAPVSMRNDLCTQAHSGFGGGHLGVKRTLAQLERRAYWVGRSSDVTKVCRACVPCCSYHRGKLPHQGLLKPTVVGDIFDRVCIDITGPHVTSRNGFSYILTIVDSFTKYAEAIPLRNIETITIAEALISCWITHHGVPLSILTDRGSQFESALFQDLCLMLGVRKLRTTAYKSSTNGAVERFHKTLNSMLAKVVDDDQRDWDRHIPAVMAAYRSSKHDSTGFSPNFLVFGRELCMPIDVVMGAPPEHSENSETIDQWVNNKVSYIRRAYEQARHQLGVVAERNKELFDRRVKQKSFKVGDWVWVYRPKRRRHCSPKWSRWFEGPYLIERALSDVNFVVRKSPKSDPLVVHIDKLKSYTNPNTVSWLENTNGAQGFNSLIHSKTKRRVYRDLDFDPDRPARVIRKPIRFTDDNFVYY
jgi:transposase InsO family protein